MDTYKVRLWYTTHINQIVEARLNQKKELIIPLVGEEETQDEFKDEVSNILMKLPQLKSLEFRGNLIVLSFKDELCLYRGRENDE